MARRAEDYVRPPFDFVLVSTTTVTGTVDLPADCRGLHVGKAGFLNVEINGQTRNALPFPEGTTPGFFTRVFTSTGTGAAQNVWAII